MAELVFTKLQGNGNDFILIDEFERELIPEEMKAKFASLYADRRFGIGADGVLFLSKGEKAPLKMRIFNPDESEAEMCGNGIRCLAKYIVDKGYDKYLVDKGYTKDSFPVETLAGVIQVSTKYDEDEEFIATIGMPAPKFNRSEIPATGEGEYKEEILEIHRVRGEHRCPSRRRLRGRGRRRRDGRAGPRYPQPPHLPHRGKRELRREERGERPPYPDLRAGGGGRDPLLRHGGHGLGGCREETRHGRGYSARRDGWRTPHRQARGEERDGGAGPHGLYGVSRALTPSPVISKEKLPPAGRERCFSRIAFRIPSDPSSRTMALLIWAMVVPPRPVATFRFTSM